MEEFPKPSRRILLQRGLLLVVGAMGLGAASKGIVAPGVLAPPAAATTLRLYGRHWHLFSSERKAGELPARGDRLSVYGELLNAPGGSTVGEFYAASFHLQAPFGSGEMAAESAEMHTFNLADGSIIGMGTSAPATGVGRVYAIVGGTGRYIGARGSYISRQNPLELGGDGSAEFELTLMPGA